MQIPLAQESNKFFMVIGLNDIRPSLYELGWRIKLAANELRIYRYY